jgi:hypothetical protein
VFCSKAIEDIRVGDMVLARDQHDRLDDVELKPVTDVFVRTSNHIRHLTIVGGDGTVERLETTDEHPFWVDGRGWVDAGGLIAGDRLVSLSDGVITEVQSTARVDHPAGITVYNFEVAGDHTYFVADADTSFTNPVWVHNTYNCPIPTSRMTDSNLQKNFTKHGQDFGLSGHWKGSQANELRNQMRAAIDQHLANPPNMTIIGGYQVGRDVFMYLTGQPGSMS